MQFSEAWLRSLIAPSPQLETKELADRLTMLGLEVDAIVPAGKVDRRVIVAGVISVSPVGGDASVQQCSVAVGAGARPLNVLCGAPNLRRGMKAVLAQAGAEIRSGRVESRKIRGLVSEAVLVSEAEIGLGEQSDMIIELESSARPGEALQDALGLDDVCISLDLTPDRGDCLGLIGIARDLSASLGSQLALPGLRAPNAEIEDQVSIKLESPEACASFHAAVARDLDTDCVSPAWLRERLRRSGLRSIHPVVDITNYVMLELGRPLHAFDLARVQGGIVVRNGREGERVTLLDGRELALDSKTLVVCDHCGPMALAGIMGDALSGVTCSTRDVVIECAWFNPLLLGRTARRLGIQTDASSRFERGVDPSFSRAAVDRARQLLVEVCAAKLGPVASAVSEAHLPQPKTIRLRQAQVQRLIGQDIEPGFVENSLSRLGFELDPLEPGVWLAGVPSHRFDVEAEADLVEEVARLHGFSNVPEVPSQGIRSVSRAVRSPRSVREFVAALGYQEVVSFSFLPRDALQEFGEATDPVSLLNPMSSDQAVMRNSLIPGLMRTLVTNLSRQQSRVRIFELGRVFLARNAKLASQPLRVAGLHYGGRALESWEADNSTVDFFDLKGDVERILGYCGCEKASWLRISEHFCHPGRAAKMEIDGRRVGMVGELHPNAARAMGVDSTVCFFELDLDLISRRKLGRYREPSRFPRVRRDLAILVERQVPVSEIEEVAWSEGSDTLCGLNVFDVYEGKGVDASDKSVAIRLTFKAQGRTLTDEEVAQQVDQILDKLRVRIGARLRGI